MSNAHTIDCGDPVVVDHLYRRLGPAAVSKTERLTGRLALAEEIVQDAFLKLWRAKARFRDEKQAYLWVYKTCHRAGVDHLRSAAVRREAPGIEPDGLGSGHDAERAGIQRQQVARLLAGLGEREALVLACTAIDSLTQDETAAALGLSRRTVCRVLEGLTGKLPALRRACDAETA